MDMGMYVILAVVGWLAAWVVSYLYAVSTMNRLLDYLRENKENRFLQVIGGGRYVPFWRRPPWGYYDVVLYVFGNEDTDDGMACKHKSAFRKAIILHWIVTASLLLLSLLSSFALRN